MKRLVTLLLILLLMNPFRSEAQDDRKVPIVEILYTTIANDGIKKGVAKYYELKRSEPDLYDFSFSELNRLGLRLLAEEKTFEAVEIFRLNLKVFPEKVTAHNNLANALVKAGKKDIARNYYLKGLEKLKAIEDMDPAIYKSYEDYGLRQIRILDELNTGDVPELTYWAYYGGIPAGNWDVDQIIEFKKKQGLGAVNYHSENFYNAPVPGFVDKEFSVDPPDVVSGFVKGVYREHKDTEIKSLTDLWNSENWDETFPAFLKPAVSYEGEPYFLPLSFQWNTIWYRKDIFDSLDLNVPGTWDELIELSETLHKHGIRPFTISGKGWQPPLARWFTILSLRLHGHEFFEEFASGSIPWTDPRIARVFEQWKLLFDHHALDTASASNNWSDAVGELASGKAAMWNIGEWLFEFKPIQEQINNFGVFPMPPIDTTVERAEILHLYGLHALTADHETSDAFLKYMASGEVQQSLYEELKYRIPANKGSHENLSDLQQQELDYLQNVDHVVPLFEFNTHPRIAQAALDEFLFFWKNPDKAEEVMERMEILRKDIYASK